MINLDVLNILFISSNNLPTISGPFLTSNHSKTTTNEESSKSVRLGDGAIFGLQRSTSLLLNGSVWLGIQSWKQIWMAKYNGSIRIFLLDYGVTMGILGVHVLFVEGVYLKNRWTYKSGGKAEGLGHVATPSSPGTLYHSQYSQM